MVAVRLTRFRKFGRSQRGIPMSLLVVALMQSVTTELRAEDGPARSEARAHFQRGLGLVQEGELREAVDAFETAYRISPHYAVLYNLGQAYASQGRSADAVRTLDRFLADGGEQIPPGRRVEAMATVARERAQLAQVEITTTPVDAEVFVNGRRLDVRLVEPIQLEPGEHVIVARMEGYLALVRTIEVGKGEAAKVHLEMERRPGPARTAWQGRIGIDCSIPGVSIWIDGVPRGVTPVRESFTVPAGVHAVKLKRPGFAALNARVEVQSGRLTTQECTLGPNDGVRHPRTEGEATRPGRKWAIAIAAGGALLGGAASAVYVWNNERYDDWRKAQARFDADVTGRMPPSDIATRSSTLTARAVRIQRADDLALGLALASGGAFVTAGALWLADWLD
jgi:hypothetical protein